MSPTTRPLGPNGPTVPAVSIGLMSMGGVYGDAGDTETRLEFLDALWEMGARHWDCADGYADAEDVVGEWFKRNPAKRRDIFYATKFGLNLGNDMVMSVRNDAEYIDQACNRSLSRLNSNYIDLYYVHRVDGKTPIEETIKNMVKAGKINYIGLSEISARTLARAEAVHHITAVQMEYSPFILDIEVVGKHGSLLEVAKKHGIAVIVYSPLGQGFLTGRYKTPADFEDKFRGLRPDFVGQAFEKNMAIVRKIEEVTAEVSESRPGVTPAQVSLAWILQQWQYFIPIPGTRTVERAKENMDAAEIMLTDEHLATIREAANTLKVTMGRYPDSFAVLTYADTPELRAQE